MKKALIALAVLIPIIVAGIGIFVATFDVNRFRPTIQADLEKQLHRPVSLGEMSLGFFPLAIRVNNVQIAEAPGFSTGRPFVSVKEIRVRAELLPLLRKEVHLKSLDLEQPDIELVSNASGQWNYADLVGGAPSNPPGGGQPSNAPPAGKPAGAPGSGQPSGAPSSGPSIALSSLAINDGSLSLMDLSKPSSRTVYDHINASLTDFAPGRTFHLKASAQLPGAKADSLVLTGSGGPQTAAGLPFDGHLAISGAPAGALAKFTGAALPVDGVVSGAADIKSADSAAGVQGNLAIDHASVHGAALGIPIKIDFNIHDDSRTALVDARTVKITAGGVVIDAAAQLNSKSNMLSARARTTNANVAELLALGRAAGAGNVSGSGTLSFDVSASGPLSGVLNYSGTASVPDARISTGPGSGPVAIHSANLKFSGDRADIAAASLSSQGLVFTNLRTTAALNHGVVTLSPLSTGIFGGTASGTLAADTRVDPQAVDANIKLQSVDANQLLSATTSLKNTIYGSLAASTNLKLRLYSASDALARSMNGTLGLNLTNGRLMGVNTLNELASIGKFVGYTVKPQTFTTIRKLSGDLNIANGVATTNNLELQMDGGSLAATGSMNLADQTLNLKTTAVLDRATSQSVGGNRIGGFMQTALGNANGELVIPAKVTGAFAHPHFEPDVEQMAQLKLKSLLPTAASPGKALSGILGGAPQQGGQQQGNPQQQIQNAVGGALNSIFNRKKKQ